MEIRGVRPYVWVAVHIIAPCKSRWGAWSSQGDRSLLKNVLGWILGKLLNNGLILWKNADPLWGHFAICISYKLIAEGILSVLRYV